MTKKTILNDAHRELGARMVDFGGWDMPVNYGSQIDEHHVVRQSVGMFDVSHMTVIDINGAQAKAFLQYLLANDVAKLTRQGKALYSCMLNEAAGIIDDLIVYFLDDNNYRLVVNASTREKDLAWIEKQADTFEVTVTERPQLAMIAVQGPKARQKVCPLLPERLGLSAAEIKPFSACWYGEWFIGRTGYTGEDGFEIILPEEKAEGFWKQLIEVGVKPCGLGARDTLRLEAGMNLYGQDMDESKHPLESGLAWTVAFQPENRHFIGRSALETINANGVSDQFVGLLLEDKGILRGHQKVVLQDGSTGEITSGGYSPTMERSIALARVPANIAETCKIDIRGKLKTARVVSPCFVRHGDVQVTL
ncbi:MAG: aminomethyltransferase [Cycloclasticus pugetii]|jgi:aminomethyltransferase|uniref:glycine cleavage system aminomethyltransferase GcvT n=1 Tax=Cycloclasticus TaxID=34067 RepID=UPI000C0F60FA|nr:MULTISPECIES: glycine cleavage system aminomethyltransferase GcvT [Cycloclasticus]MDF1829207.1 glycine cleavage system aminomethyltransferase GcvT [Cycloclasticus pugetii]PHR50827.1 MAG: glycine cleavage system protein T [Cycloclasticus sp.]